MANSRQQYWHSYLRSLEGGKPEESGDPDGVFGVGVVGSDDMSSLSSETSKPKSFKRVVAGVAVVGGGVGSV